MNDITLNTQVASKRLLPIISEVISEISANISSIGERIAQSKAPYSMDTPSGTAPNIVQMAENTFSKATSEELKSEDDLTTKKSDETSVDKDGDGIPDRLDQNQGMTVADVAAFVLKLGKYAELYVQSISLTRSSINKIKSFLTILNKLSEQLANITNIELDKNKTTRIQSMIDSIDPNRFLAMDGGILG